MYKQQIGNSAIELKDEVRAHWDKEPCGVRYSKKDRSDRSFFQELTTNRYKLEPYIEEFADFASGKNRDVLEIGVGAGVDFRRWVHHKARAVGIDLTAAAIDLTHKHLQCFECDRRYWKLQQADAEQLPLPDNSFDIVYSWGALHHSPDTPKALSECFRVLRPGGSLRIMVYHVPSWTGWMLWLRHALLAGRPFSSPREVIFSKLESPGTKAYRVQEFADLLRSSGFSVDSLSLRLSPSDLLEILPSERYSHPIYRLIFRLYPRALIRALGNQLGLTLMVVASKPQMRS